MADPKAPATIDVIAPSNLNEGYQFQVDAGGGKLHTVQVPPGGVTAGQRFSAIIVQQGPPPMAGVAPGAATATGIPTGNWRDGQFDCCNKCNAACLLGCCCSPCAVGQVMTRMNLDWKGDTFKGRQHEKPSLSTFKIVLIITAIYHVLAHICASVGATVVEYVLGVLMTVYVVLITCRTRKLIRTTYSIPTNSCGEEMEDCCCSFWCNCCVACHMGRHLVDYDQYPAKCCTDTGLGEEAPVLAEFFDGGGVPQQQQQMPPPQMPPPQAPQPPPPQATQPQAPSNDPYSRDNEQTFVVDL